MSVSSTVLPQMRMQRGEIVRMFASKSHSASRSRLLPSVSYVCVSTCTCEIAFMNPGLIFGTPFLYGAS